MSAVGVTSGRSRDVAGAHDRRNLTESGRHSCDHRAVTTSSASAVTELTIVPLTADRLPDLATLFDQGGDPKWCWCAWYRVANRDWTNSTAPQNRALLEGLAAGPQAPGLLACHGDKVVGWVSLGPREDFERLSKSRILAPIDDRPVWSIVCFVVGKRERGQGIARALLAAAIEHARASGATTLEAYPVDTGDGRLPAATVYKGTVSMFERAGFTVVARRQASASAAPRPIVRLEL
jgi:GNAT superfamily N-acetyltransferase